MKFLHVPTSLKGKKQYMFERLMFQENVQRCKLFAKIVILFELILISFSIGSKFLENGVVTLDVYLVMYLLLLLFSIVLLLVINRYENGEIDNCQRYKRYNFLINLFVILFLAWGAGVTLIDQLSYGHLMVFLVNVMCVSILFRASHQTIIQLYTIPILLFTVGLPFFQSSKEVLIGHYTNFFVFLFFCWLASRMLYRSFYINFYNEMMLKDINERLAQKVEENENMNQALERANQSLKQLAVLDELTKVPNRRGFQEYMEMELATVDTSRQLSIMMVDIDAFKLFNDHYGHFEGDKVIQEVAHNMQQVISHHQGFLTRFGGEEFVVAVFDLEVNQVRELAEEIRRSIEGLQIVAEPSPVSDYVTLSLGVANAQVRNESDLNELMNKADAVLYNAKNKGRNQVAC
ncbi:GGDEF domain-containing protein [Aquibacillus koreensis]|uniref:GGDEF domain-containing protein n=1 Tax=Aquibacillus koreensis TaxID=279446 RepID=A0A9X3WN02_9BACI|nr:GGDEF domain-containing protein [Aquibacillus koreensis]MCT2537892.1 GGDEF domain-containing protein [Aquibacillus koreensis]MDC3422660.1 GGDEF domain-containing protein [Aquibacillus koreensis]